MSDYYISPTGSGDRSGSSVANAAPLNYINAGIRSVAESGGKVLLIADAGSYAPTAPINIVAGGTASAPVTITGIASDGSPMAAHFEGSRATTYTAGMSNGNELFKLLNGANNLSFDNIDVANTGVVFRAGADISNVSISDVTAKNVGYFFQDLASGANKSATVSGLTLKDISVDGYSRGVVHLSYGSNNVLIEDVKGDSQRQDTGTTKDFPIGVHLTGSAHDITVVRTSMANAQGSTNGYWNGDGFATERSVYNVRFEDVTASGNADGGFDIKSSNTTLVRPVAYDNAHNIRVWADTTIIDPILRDPHAFGGNGGQFQVDVKTGATLTIIGGHIIDSGSETLVFKVAGTLNMSGTEVVHAATGNLAYGMTDPLNAVAVEATGPYSVDTKLAAPLPPVDPTPLVETLPPVEVHPTPAPVDPTPVPETTPPGHTDPVVPLPDPTPPVDHVPPVETPSTPVPPVDVTPPADPAPTLPVLPTLPVYNHGLTVQLDQAGTFIGSAVSDHFRVSIAASTGKQVINGFGADDMIVTETQIYDRNPDGIVQANAKYGTFGLGEGDTLRIDGVKTLRYLGVSEGEHIYASAATRQKGFTENNLGDNIVKGDTFDRSAQQFFFDNALDVSQGKDRVQNFGARDVIVTTQALETAADGKVHAGPSGFGLHQSAAGFDDGFAASDIHGRAVTTLEADGSVTVGGIEYFVYSLEGSAGGLANLHALGLF